MGFIRIIDWHDDCNIYEYHHIQGGHNEQKTFILAINPGSTSTKVALMKQH